MWTDKDAIEATGGKSSHRWAASGISIDTRTIEKNNLFIAIKGENFNGHRFVNQAIEKGACACVVSENISVKDAPILMVDDTMKALWNLAKFKRANTNAKIIAITGSVGKTSVKDSLSAVLSECGKTHATSGNYNNHIGMPFTLATMPDNADFGVFELGMNHAGEISALSKLLKPHVAIITTIEAVHMEFFESINDIAEAKAEIFEVVSEGGAAVIPFDSPYYELLKNKAEKCGIKNIISFGEGNGADVKHIQYIDSTNIQVGKHHAINSLAVISAVKAIGENEEKALMRLSCIEPTEGRGKMHHIADGITLIDDSYNASPISMRAAFSVLDAMCGRRIAVLGDMLELGKNEVQYHIDLNKYIMQNNIDIVFTAGDLMYNLHNVLPIDKKGKHCKKAMELLPILKEEMSSGDVILVKGSHGSEMWKLSKALLADGGLA